MSSYCYSHFLPPLPVWASSEDLIWTNDSMPKKAERSVHCIRPPSFHAALAQGIWTLFRNCSLTLAWFRFCPGLGLFFFFPFLPPRRIDPGPESCLQLLSDGMWEARKEVCGGMSQCWSPGTWWTGQWWWSAWSREGQRLLHKSLRWQLCC